MAIANRLALNSFFSEILGIKTPFNKSCEIEEAIANNNPAAVDKAAAIPPAAT